MSFTSDIRSTTRRYVAQINERSKAIADFERKYSTYYSPEVFQQKQGELEQAKQDTVRAAQDAIQVIVDSYKRRTKEANALNGAEVTEDAKLLSGAFNLTTEDLETMFDRAAGQNNRTMQRLISEYAEEHHVPLGRAYYSVTDKFAGADVMRQYAFNAFARPEYSDIMDSDQYFQQITPAAVKAD